MQLEYQYFLTLLIAHLLADFPFQSNAMVRGKSQGQWRAHAGHLGVHLLTTLALLALLLGLGALNPRALAVILGLMLLHGLLDWTKSRVINSKPAWDGSLLYVFDQILHAGLIALAAWLMVPHAAVGQPLIEAVDGLRQAILLPLAILLITVFPTGYLIRYLLKPLSEQLVMAKDAQMAAGETIDDQEADDQDTLKARQKDQEELSNAGLYLGWLERGLMTIAIAVDSIGAVGIILGAKSIARFPEFKSRSFAEYFLIGTLLSVLFAFGGGLLIRFLS